jgi:N-methylhydantoinase B
VASDVERGLVSMDGARAYGVVVRGDFSLDVSATDSLRAHMAAVRPPIELFNRGGTIEQLKARCKAETSFDPPRSPMFANWMRSPAAA